MPAASATSISTRSTAPSSSYAICHLLGLQARRRQPHERRANSLRAEAAKRILINDGAFGTADPGRAGCAEADYRGSLDLGARPEGQ